jgi:hypothetical protein
MKSTAESLISIADERILYFMQLDPSSQNIPDEIWERSGKQAVLGFRIKREDQLTRRTDIDQGLRAIRMMTTNPEERKAYINASMPKLIGHDEEETRRT